MKHQPKGNLPDKASALIIQGLTYIAKEGADAFLSEFVAGLPGTEGDDYTLVLVRGKAPLGTDQVGYVLCILEGCLTIEEVKLV